jgi:putative transposase
LTNKYLWAILSYMRKTFKYRIYPTAKQKTLLEKVLEECRWLHNQLICQKKMLWETAKESIGLYDQQAYAKELCKTRPALDEVHSQVVQQVAVRVDLAFKAFFRRCKVGEAPGYPRFRGEGQYHSFTYPQSGYKVIDDNRIRLYKIGNVKLKLHRPTEGKIKTCTVSKTLTGKWFIFLSCEVEPHPLPSNKLEVGIDLGLTTFATMSDGSKIQNPRFFRREEKALAKAQRKLSKQNKGTPERSKDKRVVAKAHERSTNKRTDFCHQESRKIVNKYGIIFMEDLNIRNMLVKGKFPKLSKSISDAAWGLFLNLVYFKAESAGRTVVRVNPAFTTQDCSGCGTRQVLKLSDRTYSCGACGLSIDRDLNAARNILRVGLHSLAKA